MASVLRLSSLPIFGKQFHQPWQLLNQPPDQLLKHPWAWTLRPSILASNVSHNPRQQTTVTIAYMTSVSPCSVITKLWKLPCLSQAFEKLWISSHLYARLHTWFDRQRSLQQQNKTKSYAFFLSSNLTRFSLMNSLHQSITITGITSPAPWLHTQQHLTRAPSFFFFHISIPSSSRPSSHHRDCYHELPLMEITLEATLSPCSTANHLCLRPCFFFHPHLSTIAADHHRHCQALSRVWISRTELPFYVDF